MLRRSATVALAILATTQAHAICTQHDLTGSWRFEFDTGLMWTTGSQRIMKMSCILRIKNNGAVVPRRCDSVDATGYEAEFINSGNRRLRMNLNNCEVRLSGSSSPRIVLFWQTSSSGGIEHHFDNARLSISKNRQIMLGWLSFNDKPAIPAVSVTALKRARP
jgi:hypothetical protein